MWRIPFILAAMAILAGCESYEPSPQTTYEKDGQYYCEIHDRALRQVVMPITYGFMVPQMGESDNRMMYFPNARSCVNGGCSIDDSSPHWARAWYCGLCRDAEKAYFAAHPHDSPGTEFYVDPDGKPAKDIAHWTLAQTHGDAIWMGLGALESTALDADPEGKQRAAVSDYVKVMRKMESRWEGYVGQVVSMKGKQPHRQTLAQLQEDEFRRLASSCIMGLHDSALYVKVKPAQEHSDAKSAWVRQAIILPTATASSEAKGELQATGKDANGRPYRLLNERVGGGITHRCIAFRTSDGQEAAYRTFLGPDSLPDDEFVQACSKLMDRGFGANGNRDLLFTDASRRWRLLRASAAGAPPTAFHLPT